MGRAPELGWLSRRVRGVRGRLRSRALLVRGVRRGRAQAMRSGAGRPRVTTLVFANPYARLQSVPELAPFLANVERLGEGRLQILVVNGWTSPHDRDEERTVLDDVAGGVADLGWAGARAVGAVLGVRSLDPLHAPLLFPDEQTLGRCLRPDDQEPFLSPLRAAGIVGLALIPGELRRPFGFTGPLCRPADWDRKMIRTHTSISGEAAVRALGAIPVLRSSAELGGGRPEGIDGMDLHPRAVAAWGYTGWFTWNVPLWPRILLLTANRRTFERLSTADRTVLEQAAQMTIPASADAAERSGLPESVTIADATEDDLELLRHRLRPVWDELRATNEGEETLAHLERLVANPAADRRP